MPKLNFEIDEAALLKAYKISSLNPTWGYPILSHLFTQLNLGCRKWEDVDHELEDSVAGALTSSSGDGEGQDPLGIGGYVK